MYGVIAYHLVSQQAHEEADGELLRCSTSVSERGQPQERTVHREVHGRLPWPTLLRGIWLNGICCWAPSPSQ